MLRKRLFICLCLLCSGFAILSAQSERSAVWTRLYRRAPTLSDKLTLMESAAENPSADLIPMLLEAIDELNAMREQISRVTERAVHTDLSKVVIRTIGEVGAADAADLVFDVARNAVDPYLRGEAIYTTGRLGARQYADDIAIMLRNLNLNLDTGQEDKVAEVLAYSCLLALERLKEPVGFSPVFFASIGWYSPVSGVRPKAALILRGLVDDPTDMLLDIVRFDPGAAVKLEALEAEAVSHAPADRKSMVASEALRQGLIRQPRDVSESSIFSRMRLRAMELLLEYGTTSDSTIAYLVEVMKGTYDINERLTAIMTIGAQQVPAAIDALAAYLRFQNDRQLAGVTTADYRIIRTTIQVLGSVGAEAAEEELLAVRLSNWPPSIVREANAVLAAMGE